MHHPRPRRIRMRKRRVTAEQPGLEPDEASPSKRRSIGERVGAAVSRIEAAEAATARVERVAAARPAVGQESPDRRWCAFCGQAPNRASKGSRYFIEWKLCRVLRDADGREIRWPPTNYFPVLGEIVASQGVPGRPAEQQPRYPRELQTKAHAAWPNGDCPTPHWSCWACAKIAKSHARAVGKVAATVDLPASGALAEPGQNAQFVARVNGVRVGRGETAVLAGTTDGSLATAQSLAAEMLSTGEHRGSPELEDARRRWSTSVLR